jgi:hypothetical protein
MEDDLVVRAFFIRSDRGQEDIERAEDLVLEVVNPLVQARRARPAKVQDEELDVRQRRGFEDFDQLYLGRIAAVLNLEPGVQLRGEDLGVKLQKWIGHKKDIL